MKTFLLWIFIYIPAVLNILVYILYFTGVLDTLGAKYGIDVATEMQGCIIK